MKKEVLLVGAGGHAKSIIDTLRAKSEIKIIGILDKAERVGEYIEDIPIIGIDDDLELYYKKGIRHIVLSIGSVWIPQVRYRLCQKIKAMGYSFPNIVDDTAVLSDRTILGEGVYIGKGAIINTGTSIGDHCVINTGSIVEHDCKIHEFVHIAPGATLCGSVEVHKMTHIGAGATIIQNKKIGSYSVIGSGSVVVTDIAGHMKAYGNPCKEVCRIE